MKRARAGRRRLEGLVAALDGPELVAQTSAVEDWRSLYDEAFAEGVGGLLYDALDGTGLEPPGEVRREVGERLARDWLWCAKLAADLERVQRALDAAGIRAVTLKGIVLAERFYAKAGLRPAGDLDLLVVASDFDAAAASLKGIGYRRPPGTPDLVAPDRNGVPHALAFEADDRVPVELHRAASSGFATRLAAEPLVARSIPYRTDRGLAVRILEPVDEALYLAVHGVRHRFQRLGWLWEVGVALRRLDGPQRRELVRRAREAGLTRALALAVEILTRRLGASSVGAPGLDLGCDAAIRLAARASEWPLLQRVHPTARLDKLGRFVGFVWYRALLAQGPIGGVRHAGREIGDLVRRLGRRRVGR